MPPDLITEIPGPRSRQLARELRAHESRNVTYVSPHFPIFWERAEGANVWDVDGNRFLDFTSGFGVASLGYAPPEIIAAAQTQLGRLYHAMGDVHPTTEKVALCRRLSQLTFEGWNLGPAKTILTNSGSEAVEAALKTAWLATGRRRVLSFHGSYHGLGYGALTVTGRGYFRSPFSEQLADFATFLPFPDAALDTDERAWIESAARVLEPGDIGAIIAEPIQGRGGEIVPPDWFLPSLRALADRFGAVLIFDEIYTGFHRTGRRFACDHWNVRPDLICLGKALTGGFPLAACVGTGALMDQAWPESTGEALHTSTFLGNPLGCRMALASLDLLEVKPWSKRARELGTFLRTQLENLPRVNRCWGRVRGLGLMQGIELLDDRGAPDAARAGLLVEETLQRGLILLSGGTGQNVLSFTPPFVLAEEEIIFAKETLAGLTRIIP
jgi:4-aminobutyrate aminotransferase-like enzyme